MSEELVKMLLPDLVHDVSYYKNKYVKRDLPTDAIVTRFAPSPTGFVHLGSLFQLAVARKMANQTNGVLFLRIEDTDQERKVVNGIVNILDAVKQFGFTFDEGPIDEFNEVGDYGPYIQSKRKDIYLAFVADLLLRGLAYPDFTTKEELDEIRHEQEVSKRRIGYYGKWARSRFLSEDEIRENLANHKPYIIRLRNNNDYNQKVIINDAIRGRLEFPCDDIDQVLIKNDGLPTYHFAHVIDDYLMGTTHVIRGDEWLSSLPVHINLFNVLGIEPPIYCHIPPLSKKEGNTIRKLSKRKDAELAVSYYHEMGIPNEAVMLYLMTIANSNFEEWYNEHDGESLDNFVMSFDKVGVSGALFDMDKLLNISKNLLSNMSASDVYSATLAWANCYDKDFASILVKYKDTAIKTLDIERNTVKKRKDFAMFSEVKANIFYMFPPLFSASNYEWQSISSLDEIRLILDTYLAKYYDINDSEEVWFSKMKAMCDELGYASDMKAYKQNPSNYKGSVADVSMVIRLALTTKSRTPNLYDIMQILGLECIKERFSLVSL